MRHPEHEALDATAGEKQRRLRTGHVRHHRRRIAREDREQLLLQHFGSRTHRGEKAKRQNRLIAALERVHVRANAIQALDRILDADGQVEKDEPELVAEPVRFFHRPQIDGHERAQHDAVDGIAFFEQVTAESATDAREQNVIDRSAQRFADRFHFG